MPPDAEMLHESPLVPKSAAPTFDAADPGVVTTPVDRRPRRGSALCLSGGGSRAMLYHAGAILRLAEIGALAELDCVSSVSGGSITAGLLATVWARRGSAPSAEAVNRDLVPPLLEMSARFIDIPAFITGTLLPGSSPGRRLAAALDQHLYHGLTIGELPETPEFVINATNLGTGVLWRFSKAFVGDYQVGGGPRPRLRVSSAVAASSAFPPFFAPFTLKFGRNTTWPIGGKLDAVRLPAFRRRVDLGDGGIYDNLGLETAWKRFGKVFVSDGGGTYALEPEPPSDPIRLSLRVASTIDHQVRSLRLRQIMAGYESKAGRREGAFWGIRTPISKYPLRADGIDALPERTKELALVGTHMRGLDPTVARRLVNWGYLGCDASLRSYVNGPTLAQPKLPFESEGI
jgi:NTE family protein